MAHSGISLNSVSVVGPGSIIRPNSPAFRASMIVTIIGILPDVMGCVLEATIDGTNWVDIGDVTPSSPPSAMSIINVQTVVFTALRANLVRLDVTSTPPTIIASIAIIPN